MKKISCVQTTFRRFKCVEQTYNFFLAQDYTGEKELIIFNTDEEHPYVQTEELTQNNVIVVNNGVDYITKLPYTNVGAIRRDALTHATGDYFVTWDDDDIFMPYFLRQAIDRMSETKLPSFKPKMSFFKGSSLVLCMNTLEASVVSDINLIRKYGFLLETGKEGLGWYTKMRDNKELEQYDNYYIPSYCFNWADGASMNAGHKQSGDIDNPNNFENHKKASNDIVTGYLNVWDNEKLNDVYKIYYEFIMNTINDYPKELIEKYIYI